MINRPVPRFANPADFFMKILSVKYPKTAEDEANLEDLTRNYRTLLAGSVNAENKLIKLPVPADYENAAEQMAPVSIQIQWLFHRSWILAKREPRLSRAKFLQTVVVALFMMSVFGGLGWGTNLDVMSDTQSMAGGIYFTTVLQMFLNFLPTVIVFQSEKPIFVRERDSGLYQIWIYATTKLLAEIPIMLAIPFLLNAMLYFVIGYEDRLSVFFEFYLILLLMVQAASSLGYFLSSVFNHETTAVAFSPIINLPLNLLGGYMINLINIFHETPQKYIAWLSYVSPVRWGFQGLMIAQFKPIALGIYGDASAQLNAAKVLDEYFANPNGLGTYKSYWTSVYYLLAIFVLFRVMVIVSLVIQDTKFGEVAGDTRNQNIGQEPKRPAQGNQGL